MMPYVTSLGGSITSFTQFSCSSFSDSSKRWAPPDGVWMAWWMRYQIFAPILLLLFLNLFWYYLMIRIGYRWVLGLSHSLLGP